ncbi:MAG: Tfp pilus assembly protein PilO [Bacteriovoracaceae bacterium]|jgi:Tfp pilus assembly protein PilO
MGKIVSNLHWFIILYVSFNLYMTYEEKMEAIELKKASIPAVRRKIAKKRKEKKQLKQYFKDIENAKQKIERVAAEVESLQKQLPNSISDTENLELIKGLAEGLNIKNVFLTPGTEENKGFYMVKRYEFAGTGTFLQFLVFFEKVAENDRLLNITSFNMSKTDKKQRGRFQLVNCKASIIAYRYNPNHKEDRGIDLIEKEFDKKAPPAPRKRKKKKKK